MGFIKGLVGKVRERRLTSKSLRKLDKDDRAALITLGLTALFCVIDGEVSDDDEAELQAAWLAFRVARENTP